MLRNGAGAHVGQALGALNLDRADLGGVTIEDLCDFFQSRAPVVSSLAKDILGDIEGK